MGTGLATRMGRFRLVATANLTTALVFATLGLFLGLVAPGDLGVVVARACAATTACLVFLGLVARMSAPRSSWRPRGLGVRRLWSDSRQFLLFNTPYSLVGGVSRDLPLYVFAVGGGAPLAASYALASTITQAPTTLISGALSSVFYREASLHLGSPRLKRLALVLVRWGLLLSAPGFALVTVWGDEVFVTVFGASWRTAGEFAQLLAVPLWLALQNGWAQRLFEAAGRQRVSFSIQVGFDSLHAVVVVGLFVATGSAHWALAGYAVTYSAFHLTYLTAVFGVAGFGRRALARILVVAALDYAVVAAALGLVRTVLPVGGTTGLVVATTLVVVMTVVTGAGLRAGRVREG